MNGFLSACDKITETNPFQALSVYLKSVFTFFVLINQDLIFVLPFLYCLVYLMSPLVISVTIYMKLIGNLYFTSLQLKGLLLSI